MLAHRKLLTGEACNAEGYSRIGMYPVTMEGSTVQWNRKVV